MKAFEEQLDRLVALGYPAMLGCSAGEFREHLDGLRAHVSAEAPGLDVAEGTVAYVLVVNCAAAPVAKTLPLVVRDGRAAIERLFPRKPDFFRPAPSLAIPSGHAYLLLDVDRGNSSLNAVPKDARARIAAEGRMPLTIEEGVALLTQYPEFLQPNHCFMMLGSRGDDKRVPALWLSGKQPKLGWCWEGNPHTWLGFASCSGRSPGVAIPG
ncbi:hypothetical protein SAMN05216350_102527 [Polaromonas sp. YR568]|uniref:DUF5701 family protein n=1 Tax=Polaromonas sp. YR568 TaxID=1855301 RepID=UPI0008E26A80|nr:DUF5701 family protein [Polaromonas sp. YR568]SFU55161.1 hypothetical protein SAMN05216350_102527 [Polaromonas sp. YR568]